MDANNFRAQLTRVWKFLKLRPYVISLFFVAFFFFTMWAMNREKPYLLSDLPSEVLATATANFCVPEAKFKFLKTSFKHEYRLNDVPVTVTVERIEENVGRGIALRREKWFHDNSTWPIYESRQYIAGGFMSLKFDDREPMPLFGSLLKEDGWARSKTVELRVKKRIGLLGDDGGACEFEKRSDTDLNEYTGLREDMLQQTRCITVSRLNASKIHPRLSGDAYQVNCEGERAINTTGGIPSKEKKETTKRVHVYYFVPAWSWLISARRNENSDLAESGDFKGHFDLTQFSVE